MRLFTCTLMLALATACARPQPAPVPGPGVQPVPQQAPGPPAQVEPQPPSPPGQAAPQPTPSNPAKPQTGPLPPLTAVPRVPLYGAGVALDTPVVVLFSAPVVRETAEHAFRITPPVSGTLTWQDDLILIFRPSTLLEPETEYEVSFAVPPVPREASKFLGFSGSPWTFRTGRLATMAPSLRHDAWDEGPFSAAAAYLVRAPEQLSRVEAIATGGGLIFVLDSHHPWGWVAVLRPDGAFLRRQVTLADLAIGDTPRAMAAGPDGALYMVCESPSGFTLYVFRPDGSLRERKSMGEAPIAALAVDGERLLLAERAPDRGSVRILRTADLHTSATFSVPAHRDGPHGIAGGPGGTIYLLSSGRFYHFSAEGEMLWALEDPPLEGPDPSGTDRLHVNYYSKTGPIYPSAMVPSEEGVWVLDMGWAKEIVPGKGFVRKERTTPDPLLSGAAGPNGGLLLGSSLRLDIVQDGQRRRLEIAPIGGPTAFHPARFAATKGDGVLLIDWVGAHHYSAEGRLLSSEYRHAGSVSFGPDGSIWTYDIHRREVRPLEGHGGVLLSEPYLRVVAAPGGFVAIQDRRVVLLDDEGKPLNEWRLPIEPSMHGFDLLAAPLPDGRIAVLDGPRVFLLDREKGIAATWGKGAGFRAEWRGRVAAGPEGIAATPDGNLLISDTLNSALKAFTPEGRHLWTYTRREGAGALDHPTWLAADPAGFLWVGDVYGVVRLTWR